LLITEYLTQPLHAVCKQFYSTVVVKLRQLQQFSVQLFRILCHSQSIVNNLAPH